MDPQGQSFSESHPRVSQLICENSKKIDIRHWKGGWPPIKLPDGRIVEVVSTGCHFGRERYWFLCPQCGRRCAILYPHACRICAKGRYESELMSPAGRLTKKALRIRAKVGQKIEALHGSFPKRPKGMHRTTYNRLKTEGEAIEEQIFYDLAARCLGVPRDQLISALNEQFE